MERGSLYAIVVYVILILIENYISWRGRRGLYQPVDTVNNVLFGLGSLATVFVLTSANLLLLSLFYNLRIVTLDSSRWHYWVLLFFGEDLCRYWFHRTSHHVRYLWASHVIHHSSRQLNFSVSFRQSLTADLSGIQIFWGALPLLGFQPVHVLWMQSVNLIYQFWLHTETIRSLPAPIEFLFNTPSHHRVHHSSESKYLNRNFGGVLIVWDRLFKSFVAEEPASFGRHRFGLTTPGEEHNFLELAFREWVNLIRDALAARSVSDFARSVFHFPAAGSKRSVA